VTDVNKWMLHRAGFLNFWYYDEQMFHFADGKLLLRGNNGSGKSVTMQSLLPVLLDGRKSPDRLDPFGSKARRMEDYLLGEKGVVDRDERTGYLFIEYKRSRTDQYLTTGIGLQAKRHKNMSFWGFVILDNRRIGLDLHLYKTERQGGERRKVPLSRIELTHRLADGGVVVRTQGEYMQLVNKYIFGFSSLESYEDLIKLLIQLRSPKLSKDFKPSVIYEILEAALPPLSDEDLRPLSDTIDHMDQTKQQLEQLQREVVALQKLTHAYDRYNQYVLAEKATEAVHARNRWQAFTEERENLIKKKAILEKTIDELSERILQLEQLKEVTEQERLRLSNHEVWNLEDQRKSYQQQREELWQDLQRKEQQLDRRRRQEFQYREQYKQNEEKAFQLKRMIEEKITELTTDAEDAGFTRHALNLDDYKRNNEGETFDLTVWKQEADQHYQTLNTIDRLLLTYENLKTKHQELSKEYGEIRKAVDQLQAEEKQWMRALEEERSGLEDRIHSWVKQYPCVPVSDEAMQQALRALHGLYEHSSYEAVRQPFWDAGQFVLEQLHTQIIDNRYQRELLEKTSSERKQELEHWQGIKHPEPTMHPATRERRAALKEANVPFIPFYEAVEFHGHVTAGQKERIESALMEMGLLDALIMEDDIQLLHDKQVQLRPGNHPHTLADYLKPDLDEDAIISVDQVEAVLQSIAIRDDGVHGVFLSDDGFYSNGLLRGHAPPQPSQWIGRSARERYRLKKISEIKEQLDGLHAQKMMVQNRIQQLEAEVEQGKQALDLFPVDQDLQYAYEQMQTNQLARKQKMTEQARMDERLKEVYQEYKRIKRTVEKEMDDIPFPPKADRITVALTCMRQYEKALGELTNLELGRVNLHQERLRLIEQIEQQGLEVDAIQGECDVLEDRMKRLLLHIESIDKHLEQMGVADIRQRIQEVQEQIKEVESELKVKGHALPKAQADLEQIQTKMDRAQAKSDFWKKLSRAWIDAYKREVDKRFVDVPSMDDPWESASDVARHFASFYQKHERAKVAELLTKTFYSEQSHLMEYRLTQFEEEISSPEWMISENWTEEQQLLLNHWRQVISRNLIEMDFEGQRVSPYFVVRALQGHMDRNREYLKKQDRELYQEIILNSIGNMLRSRIQRAMRWVEKMNQVLKKRNNSTGLLFSIRWKPRTAEADEELDTQDLVDLLCMNSRLLKESDLERITRHFRSKIDRAKALADESGVGNTLHQVLLDVLDYRKWFSFLLFYTKENETMRELTDRAFYRFSGGEKAMAMYIPLFTAAYSRYQEADDTAPYIISLDEAFAGVDENNIRDMFAVMEELRFNYILNSQALWGDYDTVSKLSICELVRPKNADTVNAIPYYWNGHVRSVSPELASTAKEVAASLQEDESR
jgi:uncharacterized protein (TIGR02680 family)